MLFCAFPLPAFSRFPLAVTLLGKLRNQNISVILMQLVGHHSLVVVQILSATLQMLLVYVEVDALVVYLLLQNLVVLVLHKLRKRLLLV